MSARLPSYGEVASLVERLPDLVRDARRARGLTLRDVSAQCGVDHSTISRIEDRRGAALAGNVVALLRWLDQSDGRS